MKIVLVSRLSGSGKSAALKQLEDLDYYCTDDLSVEMLPALVMHYIECGDETRLGVSVDIRSRIDAAQTREQIRVLREEGHEVEMLFLEAEESVLTRRYFETRRGHPLARWDMTLLEDLQKEHRWFWLLCDLAYCIDTSGMNA